MPLQHLVQFKQRALHTLAHTRQLQHHHRQLFGLLADLQSLLLQLGMALLKFTSLFFQLALLLLQSRLPLFKHLLLL